MHGRINISTSYNIIYSTIGYIGGLMTIPWPKSYKQQNKTIVSNVVVEHNLKCIKRQQRKITSTIYLQDSLMINSSYSK